MATEKRAGRLKEKSFAVASGKGGVGKTTTAVNLALYAARKGLRTGLLDLDPLSDAAALLDIGKPEHAIKASAGQKKSSPDTPEKKNLADYRITVFEKLDLLFPSQKLSSKERVGLFKLIFEDFALTLDESYDLLIFDMPAGSDYEENIRFLPPVGRIIIVTNPEPTAHVAAGHFIKVAAEALPHVQGEPENAAPFFVWHNRYTEHSVAGFDPKDIVGTYNRNVAEEDRLEPEIRERLEDLAFIPSDQSLDLLQGTPDLMLLILRNILSVLVSMLEARTEEHSGRLPFSKSTKEILRYHLSRYDEIADIDATLEETGGYLKELLMGRLSAAAGDDTGTFEKLSLFTAEEEDVLRLFIAALKADELRTALGKTARILEREVNARAEAGKLFSAAVPGQDPAAVDRSLTGLLVRLCNDADLPETMRNFGGLLLFHFSLSKLFRSQTVTELVYGLIPKKSDRKGHELRDRNAQIRSILGSDTGFKRHISNSSESSTLSRCTRYRPL